VGVTLFGRRANVTIDQVVSANGPRVPNSAASPKNFNFAFLLVVPRSTTPTTEQVAKLDRIRRGWEEFFPRATDFRGTARTSLARALSWAPRTMGLLAGATVEAQLELDHAAESDITVTLTSTNPTAVAVPENVVIPAGSRSAPVSVTAAGAGRASVSAAATGFESSLLVIEALADVSTSGLALSVESGNQQIGSPESTLPHPLSVALRDPNRIPIAGVRVDFAVRAGDASLSPSGAATNTQGQAAVELRLGPASGPVTVAASVPGTDIQVEFALYSVGAAFVPQAGIVQGSSFLRGAVSAGSIISIFGLNLAAAEATAASLPLPSQLAGASVEIGGQPAPLYYVTSRQINAQVPAELGQAGSASFIVRNGASASDPVVIDLRPAAPGIFSRDTSGSGPGVITHAFTNLPVQEDLPATPGEIVQIFASGLGWVSPFVQSGQPAPQLPLSRTLLPVSVSMNGIPAEVSFSGLAPGFVGLYQVNARVPEGIHGTVSVVMTVNGVASNTVTMEVR
jgi:uncharacterized protein (TIGR03437 family)